MFKGPVDGVKHGNAFRYSAAVGYRVIPAVYDRFPMSQINLYLEFTGEHSRPYSMNSENVHNTGGNAAFLSPGIQYIPGRVFLIESFVQIPVIQSLNGTQLGTDFIVGVGFRVLLY